MKTIAFVIPYYGKFPIYFQYFLKSCECNPTIDWLIFTDIIQEDVVYPPNVHCINLSFDELKDKIQSHFDFEICLDKPYKLCDYKPAYGYIFNEYLDGYDYWGYCDVDLIFGNLRKFIPEALLEKYDKIGHLGHMSLFKNNKICNTMFMKSSEFKNALSHKEIYIFDEWGTGNINSTCKENGLDVCFWDDFSDIYPYDDNFRQVITTVLDDGKTLNRVAKIEKKSGFGYWKDKATYFIMKNGNQREVAYIHFQKRVMPILCSYSDNGILCTPKGFLEYTQQTLKRETNWNRVHTIFNKKKFHKIYGTIKYWLIEKSGPIRHKIRKLKRVQS